MKRCLTILSFLLVSVLSFGHNERYNVRDFNTETGLPQNFVYGITQSPLGYLLVSTEQGIFKYNGTSFKEYTSRVLKHDIITSLCSTPYGFYFGTLNGLLFFPDTTTYEASGRIDNVIICDKHVYFLDHFSALKVTDIDLQHPKTIVSGGRYSSLCENRGEIYFLDHGKLNVLDPKTNSKKVLFGSHTFSYLASSAEELVLVNDSNRVFVVKNNRIEPVFTLDPEREVSALKIAVNLDIWIGTKKSGVICLSPTQNGFEKISYTDKFNKSPINFFYEDDEDNIWVGTQGNGLLQLVPTAFPFKNLGFKVIDANTLGDTALLVASDTMLTSFKIDEDGLLLNGKSFYKHRLPLSSFTEFRSDIVIGTDYGLYVLSDDVLKPLDGIEGRVTKVKKLSNNRIAAFVVNQGMFVLNDSYEIVEVFNLQTGFPGNNVEEAFEDAKGNVWVYFLNSGLVKIKENKQTELLTTQGSFPNVKVTDIKEDHIGKVWIVTEGQGIYISDSLQEGFLHLTIEDGLLSNFPSSISFHNLDVWVFFKEGIQKINNHHHIIKYHKIDHANTTYSKHSIWAKRGVFAISKNGIKQVDFKVDSVEHQLRTPYFQKITLGDSVICNNEATVTIEEDFGHDENNVTIDFISVFLKYNQQFFRYKLEGLEQDWKYTTDEPSINYTNLTNGDYTFVVQNSKDEFFDTFKETKFSFGIEKPYWDEWWFFVMQILVLISLAWLLYRLSRGTKNRNIIRFLSYIAIFLVFDFIHELAEPFFIESAKNITIIKISINLFIALLLYPLEILIQRNFSNNQK